MPTAAATTGSANSKRPVSVDVAPIGRSGSDDDAPPSVNSKRRRVEVSEVPPQDWTVRLERDRAAAQVDSAETAAPVVDARAPAIPPSAPALQQLVRALGMREPDLQDHVRALVCMRTSPGARPTYRQTPRGCWGRLR